MRLIQTILSCLIRKLKTENYNNNENNVFFYFKRNKFLISFKKTFNLLIQLIIEKAKSITSTF